MEHYVHVQVMGELTSVKLMPVSGKLPPRCEATVKVEVEGEDNQELAVTAYGEKAEQLAAVEEKTPLLLKGDLKRVTWETGEFKKRERQVLVVTQIDRFRKKREVKL